MSHAVPSPIIETIRSHDQFVITTHQRPDADAIGSMLALHLALKQMGKRSQPIYKEPVPEACHFLAGSSEVRTTLELGEGWNVVGIVLDCEGPPRASVDASDFDRCDLKVVIDHHATTSKEPPLNWVVPEASATGELLFDLLCALGAATGPDIATDLYAAITTDTGGFRFSNTTPYSLTVCARLVELGADVRAVSKHLFEERSFAATKLAGRALGSLETDCSGLVAWATLTRRDFQDCGAADDETEGIVNHIKGVRGSEVAILFREDSEGKTRVSLRSESHVDVSQISHRFGGGGHVAAAGCTLSTPLSESRELILDAVRSQLATLQPKDERCG